MPTTDLLSASIAERHQALEVRIEQACHAAGRERNSVVLIGAAKIQGPEQVREAYSAGVREFGENYVDEGIDKVQALSDLNSIWHFIGRIQSNKTRQIATHFDWVHTIDRPRIATRLNEHCPDGKRLQVLIQVNIDEDPNKAGVSASACADLLNHMLSLPSLQPRGLMTILAKDHNPADSYRSMAELHASLSAQLPEEYSCWDSLSMGMTADLEQAIAAGATHIRIGTALFGARPTR